MMRRRGLIFLVIAVPLCLPLVATVSFCLLFSELNASLLSIQYEYPESYSPEIIKELANKTFYVVEMKKVAPEEKIDYRNWIFHMDGENRVLSQGGEREKKELSNIVEEEIKLPKESSKIKDIRSEDEDPFLVEWKKSQQVVVNTQIAPLPKVEKVASLDMSIQSTRESVRKPVFMSFPRKRESIASSEVDPPVKPGDDKKLVFGQPGEPSVLNLSTTEGRYLNYVPVEGTMVVPADERELFFEISFFDRLDENGLDSDISTILSAQEMETARGADPMSANPGGPKEFSLRLPAESRGYLMAKAYLLDERANDKNNRSPVYIGAYPLNPIRVSQEGIRNIVISLMPARDYLRERQTIFSGKIVDEYLQSNQCLTDVDVWVAESNQHVKTDKKCMFEIHGLVPSVMYHLIFEKEGYATQEVQVLLAKEKKSQIFVLSPETKFTLGYEVFLGERKPDKATLFATILRDGKPLERGIVISPRVEKIVYERGKDEFSIPDSTLFSTTPNGKVILWNAKPGRNSIDIYFDGQRIGRKIVKLSSGVVHYLTLEF